jgi:hypothetical protein
MNPCLEECPHLSIPSFYHYQYDCPSFSQNHEYDIIDDTPCVADELFEVHLLGSMVLPSPSHSKNLKNKTRKKRKTIPF